MSEKIQITIEVPFAFAQREQLLSSLESKFPGAEISIAHAEVSDPTVSEALVLHDPNSEPDPVVSGEDSESILLKATDALAAFAK